MVSKSDAINSLCLRRLDNLVMHEQTLEHKVKKLVEKILSDGKFTWPIIVARGSNLIIDGTHRFAAAKELGLKHMPVQLIDYADPELKLGAWCRVLPGSFEPAKFGLVKTEPAAGELARRARTIFSYEGDFYAFEKSKSALDDYWRCREIELSLGADKLDPAQVYMPSCQAKEFVKTGAVVTFPRHLSKEEVTEVCSTGKLFPPHSTRHEIPFRIYGAEFELEDLKIEADLKKLNSKNQKILERKNFLYKGKNIVIDRLYKEHVYAFE